MAEERPRVPSTADATRAYIDEHPSIRDALRDDLVNYAFLARKVQAERGLRNEEAIEIALRRYQQEMRSATPPLQAVRDVLAHSRLEVKSRVAILRIREDMAILDRLYKIGMERAPPGAAKPTRSPASSRTSRTRCSCAASTASRR